MAKQIEYRQGTPNWVELKTSDPSAGSDATVAGADPGLPDLAPAD